MTKESSDRFYPDGGWAWLIVIGAWGLQFCGFGIHVTYGALIPVTIEYFQTTYSLAVWVSGVGSCFLQVSSPLTTALADHYGARPVVIFGIFIGTAGLMGCAFVPSAEYLILTYGFLFAFGMSFTFAPPTVLISYYFEKRRGFASTLIFTGVGLSGLVLPLLGGYLEREYTWRGCFMIFSGIALQSFMFAMLLHYWGNKDTLPNKEHEEANNNIKSVAELESQSSNVHEPVSNSLSGNLVEEYERQAKVDDARNKGEDQNDAAYENNRKRDSEVSFSKRDSQVSFRKRDSEISFHRRGSRNSLSRQSVSSVATVSDDVTLVGFKHFREKHESKKGITVNDLILKSLEPTDVFEDILVAGRRKMCIQCNPNDPTPAFFDFSLFRNGIFVLYAAAFTLSYVTIICMNSIVVSHAEDNGMDEQTAQLLWASCNGVSVFARIVIGWFADTNLLPVSALYGILCLVQGALPILLAYFKSELLFWVFSVTYGLFGANCMTLNSVVLAHIVGMKKLHSSFGLVGFCNGIAALCVPYFIGLLRDNTGTWDASLILVGCLSLVGGSVVMLETFFSKRFKSKDEILK